MISVQHFWDNGPEHPALADGIHRPSVVLCASALAGSTSLQRIVRKLLGESDDKYVLQTPDDDAFNADRPQLAYGFDDYRRDGHIYFWRSPVVLVASLSNAVAALDDYKVAIAFRDPRDTIVSEYHNLAQGHPPPLTPELNARFLADRENARREGLAGHVERHGADWYRSFIAEPVFDLLRSVAPGRVCFLSYAELCYDLPSYIDRLCAFLAIDPDPALRAHLLASEDVRQRAAMPSHANVHFKGASPLPGRFHSELPLEVVARLNDRFGDVLNWMASVDRPEFAPLYARHRP